MAAYRKFAVSLAAAGLFQAAGPLHGQVQSPENPGHTVPGAMANSSEQPADEDRAVEGCAAIDGGEPGEVVILPTTGLAFSLPRRADPAEPCPGSSAPLPARPSPPDIFGQAAVPVGARLMRADWERVHGASLDGVAGPWNELVEQVPQLPDLDPLDLANRWVNWHIRYIDDKGPDRWASPPETLQRGFGDCEDFAIAKMGLLTQMGIAPEDMFLIILRERHRPRDHAVLAVRRDGAMLVLDNRTDSVLPANQVTDYLPIFSYSGSFGWTYGQRRELPGPSELKRSR